MERSLSVHWRRRLGFRKQTIPRSETNLGPGNFAQVYSPGRTAHRNSEAIRMAYLPGHILHSAPKCRNRIQSDAGAVAAFFVAIHVGRLHAGNLAGKTCRTSSSARTGVLLKRTPPHSSKRGQVVKAPRVKTVLINEKRCKKGAKMHPFAPSLVSVKIVQLFWNEWRGRRDSNSRPLP